MAVNRHEQQFIHNEVYGASPSELEEMHKTTTETLQGLRAFRNLRGALTPAENSEFDLCIEALAKIETKQNNGGAWFCAKRRMKLIVEYMK